MSRHLDRTVTWSDQAREVALVHGDQVTGSIRNPAEDSDAAVEARVQRIDAHTVRVTLADGCTLRAVSVEDGDKTWLHVEGHVYELVWAEEGVSADAALAEEPFATSPMTGVLAKVSVSPGDAVEEGGELFIVEAMKMEYVVRAPRAITVGEVQGSAGDRVDVGAVIVTFEDDA